MVLLFLPVPEERNFTLTLKRLHEVQPAAELLASYFPQPERTRFGIAELLLNALEHGMLGIGYNAKSRLLCENRWLEEIMLREALPENAARSVHASVQCYKQEYCFTARDGGDEFNWKEYMKINPLRLHRLHGRGIAQAASISFDRLIYNESGNEVTGIIHADGAQAPKTALQHRRA